MKLSSVISSCFFILWLITPSYSTDLINSTCKTCSIKSPFLNYNFCITTLEAIPVARHVTNLQGLALIAIELAMQNATNTTFKIEKMLNRTQEYDSFALNCLQYCLEMYVDATSVLESSIEAFLSGEFFIGMY
ncbi:hypothetical protein Leryth_010831 [Lithospermum erythrorhizon]|nr:hypothetical protein Leryth_010831 [Lithospermum erythrorhizon]